MSSVHGPVVTVGAVNRIMGMTATACMCSACVRLRYSARRRCEREAKKKRLKALSSLLRASAEKGYR